MQKRKHRILSMVLIVAMTAGMVIGLGGCGKKNGDELTITNVSYDPTREFYEKYNVLFEQYYEKNFGKKVRVIQSHGGSGSQARSVVEGCNADVVTLALEHDITLIEKTGLIDAGWQKEFDKDSAPYTSTIVFLVRKGNPKQIHDWQDLVKTMWKSLHRIRRAVAERVGISWRLSVMRRRHGTMRRKKSSL